MPFHETATGTTFIRHKHLGVSHDSVTSISQSEESTCHPPVKRASSAYMVFIIASVMR